MIVDCHTHWGIVWEERDRGDASRWLGVLDRHGVDRAVLLGHYNLTRCDRVHADNDRLALLRDRAPHRLIPFGSCWPQQGGVAVDEARRCLDTLHMAGLKFHPWMQGFSTADPVMAEICALAGRRAVPILFHDGTPCYSLPEQVAGLARRFPSTTFILGHAGLLWNWRGAAAALRRPNVWACLCGPTLRAIELLCRHADPQRLLWGSDFGFGFADPIGYRLNLLRRARIEDALRDRILGANPLRLLGPHAGSPDDEPS